MTRIAIAQVLEPYFRRTLQRRGAEQHVRTNSNGACNRGRGVRYLASVAMMLGLLALSTSGAGAFNPQPDPPGAPRSAFTPQLDPTSLAHHSITRLPAGLQTALAHLHPMSMRPPASLAGVCPACLAGAAAGASRWVSRPN